MKLIKKQWIIFYVLVCGWAHFLACGGMTKSDKRKKRTEKTFIRAQKLNEDSFRLAKLIFGSHFRPTVLIVLFRGGGPIGNCVSEYFLSKGKKIERYVPLRVSAYNHNKLKKGVEVCDLDHVVKSINSTDKLLIVDDVVDSGNTMKKVLEEIKSQCGKNAPQDIKIATIYYKPQTASIKPDYYLHETDDWLVFPHELEGLSKDEIKEKGKQIADILK